MQTLYDRIDSYEEKIFAKDGESKEKRVRDLKNALNEICAGDCDDEEQHEYMANRD